MQHYLSQRQVAIAGGLIALAAAGGVAAGAIRASKRRRRIGRGEIRELQSFSVNVDALGIHTRGSTASTDRRVPPVVLVHGFGASGTYFVPAAERLAVEFDVYALDLPGHGRSDSPGWPLSIPQLADLLVAWMDAVELPRVSLVGHSMGCQIAVDAAVRYPERVERLVLAAPTVDPEARTLLRQAARLLRGGSHERFSLKLIIFAAYLRRGWRLLPECRHMLRDRIEDKLPSVRCPAMLIRGEKDPVVPQRWFARVASLVGAERVIAIPRWGHAIQYNAPEQFAEAVTPFLRDASVPTPRSSSGTAGDRRQLATAEYTGAGYTGAANS